MVYAMMSDQGDDDRPTIDPETGFVDMSRYDDIDDDEEIPALPLAELLGSVPDTPLPEDVWDAVIAHAVADDDPPSDH